MNTTDDIFERIRFRGAPVANGDSIVTSGCARFTLLTDRLLRLEWSASGTFEDRGTYAFPTRYAPPPVYETRVEDGALVIDTGELTLRYRQASGPFTADNLSITFDLNGERRTWAPDKADQGNLWGTRRTLDQCAGASSLGCGILSRAGWTLFDDGAHVVFGDDGWPTPRPAGDLVDWYFFGYGHDYQAALADYARFGGPVPMIPRFVLGAWWSRYWAYSAQDLRDLVADFEAHGLPLDVLVIDMDWHTPHAWTGYTWNRALFPDPPAFLRWVHDQGLRVTLNLHPAQGVQHFEQVYEQFAEAMGIDPSSGEPVPFRVADKQFIKHYFELLHHPMEDQGVDFWWMDWQQGEDTEMVGLDPLPWLNHLHYMDSKRGGERGMLYSRWGGLGNHRYPIGFSGDTFVQWTALQFQPYMTATASNVLYGWWSHDIGGHMGGATEPELYARWVQFGALSPCLRLHATKDPRAERRPWVFPDQVYRAVKAAFDLRYRLVPYIYTMARVATDTGVSLCRPMYYAYPESEHAYAARDQYFFGDQIIAAPIIHPIDPVTGMAARDVWVPPGTWIDYQTRETLTGPRWVRLLGDLDRVPMLVKAGAIIPLAPLARTTEEIPQDALVIQVFPGAEGAFRLYEDEGTTEAYRQGQYEWTEMRTRIEDQTAWIVTIGSVEGRCDALPDRRRYEVRLVGSREPGEVLIDGRQAEDWTYDAQALTTIVHLPMRDKAQSVTVRAVGRGPISALGQARDQDLIRDDVRRLLGAHCPADAGDVDTVLYLEAPGREHAVARLGGPFVHFFEFVTPQEAARQLGRMMVAAPALADVAYSVEAAFSLFRSGKEVAFNTLQLETATASQVLDVPFAFDGTVESAYWEAQVQVIWRGQTLRYAYRSALLFPTVYAWRYVVYNPQQAPLPLAQVMDDAGNVNQALAWHSCVQSGDALWANVNEPHIVRLGAEYRERLAADEPLAGYMATTVVSPNARDAVIEFMSHGAVDLYLNGQALGQTPVAEREIDGPPFFRRTRTTEPVRLRAGQNTLLVDLAGPSPRGRWQFGAAFLTSGGELMADLSFE